MISRIYKKYQQLRGRIRSKKRRQKVKLDYFADQLGVRHKILPFEGDARFNTAWAYTTEHNQKAWPGGTPDVRWRAYTACWAARQALSIEGEFVECGVYMGLLSLTVCGYIDLDRTDRTFWLFDTFAGIPYREGNAAADTANTVYTNGAGLDDARHAFARFERAKLIPGMLPETLTAIPEDRPIAYLSIDLNDAAYEMQVMAQLWQRIAPGGLILIDDYGWSNAREQHDAWNRFAREKNVPILALPTGQGLVIKAPV